VKLSELGESIKVSRMSSIISRNHYSGGVEEQAIPRKAGKVDRGQGEHEEGISVLLEEGNWK
tara:strand:+ start:985 stop:1170 length:186 start_codon:yes stop_codon:yes gene_type:complete